MKLTINELSRFGQLYLQGLQFVVAAKESSYGVATTHPFALNVQGVCKPETLVAIPK